MNERDMKIYALFKNKTRQKVLATMFNLSESRIKAIIGEQKKNHAAKTNL